MRINFCEKIKLILLSYFNLTLKSNSQEVNKYYTFSSFVNKKLQVGNLIGSIDENELIKSILMKKDQKEIMEHLTQFKFYDEDNRILNKS